VGAVFMFDAAHLAGLIVGGDHPDPVPIAGVVTLTTHKTLRGSRGRRSLVREEYAKAIDKSVFPGGQGGPLEHVIAGKAIAFGEALAPEFKAYQKRIVENSKAMCETFLQKGYKVVSGGTDNHLFMMDMGAKGSTG